ncbi:unnamed protein product [Blepharisma stoltei]|uniref:dual-specificity kinase n=1 Tax=Blepharisma stoltei TaxID=1481888 RepID=A0AAU9J631_9CILI|nr:unnamed protein product [Blepharisma stoltei]
MSDINLSFPRTQRIKKTHQISHASIESSYHKQVPLNPRQKLYLDLTNVHKQSKSIFNHPLSTKFAAFPVNQLDSTMFTPSYKNLEESYTARPVDTSFNSISTSLKDIINTSRIRSRRSGFKSISTPSKREIKFPISGQDAMRYFCENLTEYEQSEVLDYKEVYFLGSKTGKINGKIGDLNWGYDNEKGDFQVVLGDHIDFRYEIVSVLGKGTFGQVLKCLDHKNNEHVAVKVIRNKKRFHKQGLVEIKILNLLKAKDPEDNYNVIRIKESFTFRKHLCLSFELLSMNLYEFLKLNSFEGLSLHLVKRFSLQILNGLKYSKSLSIIHCDLKPENILLKTSTKSLIKIIDFGSSCLESERIYTYIQSRFYRAPEIMLGIPYGTSIDMWSFGCIVSELHTGYPLFPGESEQEQLYRIIEVLGLPPKQIMDISTRKKIFFDNDGNPKLIPNSRGKIRYPNTRPLSTMIGNQDPLLLEFLTAILKWDPQERLTPEQAINHPFLKMQLSPKRRNRPSISFFSKEFIKAKLN